MALTPRDSRTTGASRVGAMFQVGSRFGKGFTVPNNRARASAGRKLAYRPHMVMMWDCAVLNSSATFGVFYRPTAETSRVRESLDLSQSAHREPAKSPCSGYIFRCLAA